MKTNTRPKVAVRKTHGGSKAYAHTSSTEQLRRSVMSCLLWEKEFYEGGVSIATRIVEEAEKVKPKDLAEIAIEARSTFNLRHVPLLLLTVLVKTGRGSHLVADTIVAVIQRADELAEFISIYWVNGKRPLSKQMKVGLARAFQKFNAYSLAKYNRDEGVRLRDVLFLVHAKPKDEEQAGVWKQLATNTLPTPDTWEVELSAGKDKKATWERLITEDKLGYLALLRNLRNMVSAGVSAKLVREAILARKGGAQRVLPFRYVAAARAAPQFEPALDEALGEAISELPLFEGTTVVLVDVSGSMEVPLSARSDLTRKDAAAALASIIHGNVRMFSFADRVIEVPPRRGMAGVDAIVKSQSGGTRLFDAVAMINKKVPYDRLIVITDEQDTGGSVHSLPDPLTIGYMVNVASNRNGVGYGKWRHIDGFSEGIIRWISESEKSDTQPAD